MSWQEQVNNMLINYVNAKSERPIDAAAIVDASGANWGAIGLAASAAEADSFWKVFNSVNFSDESETVRIGGQFESGSCSYGGEKFMVFGADDVEDISLVYGKGSGGNGLIVSKANTCMVFVRVSNFELKSSAQDAILAYTKYLISVNY